MDRSPKSWGDRHTRRSVGHNGLSNPAFSLSVMSAVPDSQSPDSLSACVKALGLSHLKRHIFICADQTVPKCCDKAASLEAWDYLKKRLKELHLDQPTQDHPTCIFRTKANCLRVCQQGPILLVYPDGVWYRNATPEVIERVIQEHLLGDRIVEEFVFHRHVLSAVIE